MEFKYFTGYRNCMKTKTLDINGKVLLGVFSVVLVITSIIVMPLVLSAPPAGKGRKYKVTVHVQDSGGNPVRGAKVTIYDELENPVTDTKTTNSSCDWSHMAGIYCFRCSCRSSSNSLRTSNLTIILFLVFTIDNSKT